MALTKLPTLTLTAKASGAVTANRLVAYSGARCGTQAMKVLGVAVYDAADGTDYPVDVDGTSIVEAGAAIAVGDSLVTDNQGRAIPASALAIAAGATGVTSAAANGASALTGGNLPQFVFGDALTVAADAGAFIEFKFR